MSWRTHKYWTVNNLFIKGRAFNLNELHSPIYISHISSGTLLRPLNRKKKKIAPLSYLPYLRLNKLNIIYTNMTISTRCHFILYFFLWFCFVICIYAVIVFPTWKSIFQVLLIFFVHTQGCRLFNRFFYLLFSWLFSVSGESCISKAAGDLLVCISPVACCGEEGIIISSLAGDFHFANWLQRKSVQRAL